MQRSPDVSSTPVRSEAQCSAAAPCQVSLTGFREDDVWQEEKGKNGYSSGNDYDENASDGGGGSGNRSELEVYEQLAEQAGVVVQATLMSSTAVLVARRGFTAKRLLAARRRIPAVVPRWIADGCPRVAAAATSKPGPSEQMNLGGGAETVLVDAEYAVPWLHGYVFSTTGLTTQERAAIEQICAKQHGAVIEAALTYRCDVLLTSAECIRELQELLRRDSLVSLSSNTAARKDQEKLCNAADVNITNISSRKVESWLTDKLRFALEFDIPVVDYVKLFALLRLDRLPSPATALHVSTSASRLEKKSKDVAEATAATAPWPREVEEALSGRDFDTVVQISRVAVPVGGASRWHALLERAAAAAAAAAQKESHRTQEKEKEEDEEAEGKEGDAALNREGWYEEGGDQDRSPCTASTSSTSSSSSSSSSASTVSDPDAWEDFVQHMLVPHWADGRANDDNGHPNGYPNVLQRINAYPLQKGQPATKMEQQQQQQQHPAPLTLNTVDVDVLQPTSSARADQTTLHVSTPDYYSGTAAAACSMEHFVNTNMCQDASPCHPPRLKSAVTLGASQVSPSPRLTTNALLQPDEPPHPSSETSTSPSTALARGDEFGERINAYYAAQRREQQQPSAHRMPISAAPWRVPSAAPSVSITSAKCLAAVGGSEAQHNDTLSITTQVLVESCAAADESAGAADHSTKRNTTPPPTRKAATTTSLSARFVLPLWPMHPPYLSVCLLGCTAAEERQARVWCGVCRFLRTPVPTVETDVVLLGSRVLFRKRYTVSSANAAGSDSKKIGRGLRAPSRQRTCGGKGGSGTVTVRYWEMDAVVARVLSDTCGVALSRIAPLRWLEDAAAATQKAAVKEAAVSTAIVAEETKSEESDDNFGRIQAEARKREVETTSTPQDTLADLVHDAVQQQRLKTQQQQQQRGPVMKSGDIGEDSTPSSSFHPFPILSTDELPSLASPAYYIRLRRAYAITSTSAAEKPAVSASAAAAAAAAMAPNMAASTASHANGVEMNAKSHAVVLPQQQKKATRGSNASESSAGSPFSPVTSTTSKVDAGASPSAFTSNHNSDCIRNGGSNPRLRISNSEVNTSTHYPLSPASSAGVSGASTFTREPPAPSDAEKKFAPGDPRQQQQQQHAHDEELATASRRFNQLVGLFIVDKGDATTSLHTGKSEEGKARKADIVHSRRHVLESCSFCCVEGEYSRVDWAVLRGLIRYGGGRVEKKTAEEWVELLAKYKKKKKDLRPLLETTSTDFESSQEASGCDRPAQLHLAACVRRSIEFEKQQRKLTRLLQLLQPRHDSEHSDATTNNSDAMDEKKNAPHRLRADTLMDHADDTIDAVAQLRRKLANTARACQLSPVLSLLPHSFQHAPAAVAEKGRSASSHASTKNSDVPDAVALSTINRMHPLHGLARITQDYILASLAVGYCLNPLSCFLFCTSIPSAPDMRLFHARTLQRQQQQPAPPTQQRMIAVDQKGRGNAAAAAAQLCKPQLSAWMREKRYCKAESVGVCIAFLWRLPRSDSRWVDLVDVARGAPPSAPLVSKAAKTAKRRERYAAPSVQLVPLIRVLLLGLRNAVEAMGGHVADAYSPASATHVVVVDTEAILASSLTELYTADVPTDDTHVQPPPPQMATGADTEKEEEWERGKSGEADGSAWASHYWPAEDLTAMMRSAARHELSIVDVEWLASCVDWGIFIDEAGFPPPRNIHERIAAEQRRQQQAKRQPRSQTTKTLTQRVSNHHHLHQHPQQPRPCSPAPRLTPQSIRDGSAARHAEARKRCRTPSPTPPPLSSATADDDVDVPSWRQQTATAPDASRATAAPHTPPSPLSTKPAMVEDGMPCFVREEVAAPPQHLITPHTASLLQGGEGSFHGVGDGAADYRAHTPVMRRMRPPSTSNSNSNVQPCSTPPARPPMPASSFSSPHPVSLSSPWPSRAAPNSATPSRRSDSHSTPLRRAAATATAAAATGGVRQRSLSNSLQRRRTSLSASQHNTYSLAEQQDAEAYVEHLGSMFNFCSPGSTPLPSVRHAGEQRKQASSLPASRESGDNECTPLPDAFRDQLLSQMLSQRTSQVSENASNDVAASATQRAVSSSSVLTTPRRRTLRAVAAAMSQATATSDTPPRSPERRRRRAERSSSAAALMPLHGSQTPDLHYHEEEEEEEGRAVERVLAANVCSEEDDATVPLPCGANTPDAAAQNQVTTPDVSYRMEVVPDSQPDACDANGHEDDRGAYASFANLGRGSPVHGVSTEKGEQSLDEGASNARPSLELIGDEPPPPQQQQQQLVLAADNDDAEEDGSCSSQPQRRGTADASFALTKEGLSAGAVGDRGGKPRLGMCSAPRQTSPSPVPPHLRTAEDVVDVDADSENSTEKHNVRHPVHDTETDQRNSDRGGLPRHTHRRSHPSPAFSPWATHRPLSLSQRSSRSPVPPPPSPSVSLVEPKSNSAAVAASTTQKPTTLAALREAGESFLPSCLRVYVVHDLPHRASRVQRCLAALHGFTHPYNSSVTSALLQQQTNNNNNNDNKSNNDAENRVENEPKDAPSRAFARSTLSSSLPPPVCFVKRCEDADVCVTHEVNLRESVLVAIALGCWVVQPGFLECVAAIVESFCHNSIADHDTGLESCRRVGKDRPPTVAHVQELHLLPHPSAPSLSFRHSSPTAACYLRLCEMRPTYEWTAVTTAAPASPLHRSLVLQCRRRRQAVSPVRHARLQHENHDGNVGGQARHIAVFDRRSFLLLYASPERPNDVPSVRNTAADARVHAIRRLLTAGGGAVLSVVQVGCTQAETARSQRAFPALSCMAEVPALDDDSKCCLRRCANESQRPVKSLAARLQPKTQLTDEELYHDLVCLLCDAVFRTHRSAKSASRAHSTNPALPVQRVGSSHSNSNSDCSPHAARQHYMGSEREAANTLTILLDTSLFEKRSATPEIDENDGCGQGCGVVLTRKLGEASASELSADQPKKLEQTRDVVPGRAASSPFSPGTWLVGWLFPCDMETGHDDEAESAFYPSVERHALQMHLCACCSLAHDLAKLDSVGSAAFVPAGQDGEGSTAWTVTSIAEAKWSYQVKDIPFQVPTFDEVALTLAAQEKRKREKELDATLHLATVARLWQFEVDQFRHRVEFRCTSWAGACVAAGGAAVLSTTSADTEVVARCPSGVAERDTWMQACDAQTLLAVLPYA